MVTLVSLTGLFDSHVREPAARSVPEQAAATMAA
jgi:hypothetical protein